MLIRKDETVAQRSLRPSTRNADIGDPFAIKFIGRDFEVVFPYHRLVNAEIREDNGTYIECEGSNLRAILDSTWTARLQIVEESREPRGGNRLLPETEIVVARMRYRAKEDEPDL
jgi:hypothetical protein